MMNAQQPNFQNNPARMANPNMNPGQQPYNGFQPPAQPQNNFSRQPTPQHQANTAYRNNAQGMGNTQGVMNHPNHQSGKTTEGKQSREEFGRQYAIFSGNAAIKFYAKLDKEGNPTINVEAANKNGNTYDWSNKTSFQFMQHELGRLIAVLYGMVPEEKFDNHGVGDSTKSLSIKGQPDKRNMYIQVMEKDKKLKGAAFDYHNAMMIASMVLSQFRQTTDSNTNAEALGLIKHFVLKMHYGM
jgi:hypothetical protein